MKQASLALLLATTTALAAAAPPDAATLQRQVEELLAARVPAEGPGVAVLLARGDQLLYRGARGMASIELGVPLSPDHVFRIASLTKQFAAASLLKQVDEGRAQLGDPLAKFLPGYPNGANITLAQLLNHSSGVKSYTGIRGYMNEPIRRDLATAQLVAEFDKLPVDFAPGAGWAYNNSGYVLVGAVLESITKQPWHQPVTTLLAPLGITRITYGDHERVVPGMAAGYSGDGQGGAARAGFLSMTQPHAAGALLGTVDDLWRWNLALHGGRVLSADSYRRLTTPEGPAQARGYGYGIGVGSLRGQPMFSHGGGIHGFGSHLIWLPQDKLTVVVLRNSDSAGLNVGSLTRQLAELALGPP